MDLDLVQILCILDLAGFVRGLVCADVEDFGEGAVGVLVEGLGVVAPPRPDPIHTRIVVEPRLGVFRLLLGTVDLYLFFVLVGDQLRHIIFDHILVDLFILVLVVDGQFAIVGGHARALVVAIVEVDRVDRFVYVRGLLLLVGLRLFHFVLGHLALGDVDGLDVDLGLGGRRLDSIGCLDWRDTEGVDVHGGSDGIGDLLAVDRWRWSLLGFRCCYRHMIRDVIRVPASFVEVLALEPAFRIEPLLLRGALVLGVTLLELEGAAAITLTEGDFGTVFALECARVTWGRTLALAFVWRAGSLSLVVLGELLEHDAVLRLVLTLRMDRARARRGSSDVVRRDLGDAILLGL